MLSAFWKVSGAETQVPPGTEPILRTMSTYFITPVCRIVESPTYRQAQAQAKALHPDGKALPVTNTGLADDTVRTRTLDTYA